MSEQYYSRRHILNKFTKGIMGLFASGGLVTLLSNCNIQKYPGGILPTFEGTVDIKVADSVPANLQKYSSKYAYIPRVEGILVKDDLGEFSGKMSVDVKQFKETGKPGRLETLMYGETSFIYVYKDGDDSVDYVVHRLDGRDYIYDKDDYNKSLPHPVVIFGRLDCEAISNEIKQILQQKSNHREKL